MDSNLWHRMRIFTSRIKIMSMSSVRRFLPLFIIIIAAHGMEPYNGVTTDRLYYYIGESVAVHCFLRQTASNVTFFYNNDIPVPKENITKVNDSYAFVNITLNDSYPEYIVFYCKNGNAFIGQKEIYLEYPPQNVTNLKYEYYNQEDFKASWNLGIDYRFGLDMASAQMQNSVTVISAEYARSADIGNWETCNNTTKGTCVVYELHAWTEVSLRVTVTNVRRNDTVVTLFRDLDLDSHVRPAPVEIKVDVLNSTCVSVSWTSEKHYPQYKISGNATNITTSRKRFTRCGLHPFYIYTVSVQAMPHKGDPSEKRRAVFQMPQDAPSSGPGLIDGGYYRESCVPGNQNETVHIFFTPLKLEHRNGVIMNYTAIMTAESWSNKYPVSSAEANSFVVSVPCRKGFLLKMRAATVVGYSPETTLLISDAYEDFISLSDTCPSLRYIDLGHVCIDESLSLSSVALTSVTELHAAVQKLDLKIEEDDDEGIKTAHWTWKPEFPVNKLALYYCERKTSFTLLCKEEMPLEKIDVNPTDQNKTFTSKRANLFGLAAATANGNWTSIVFTDCIFLTDPSRSSSLHVPAPPKVVQDTGLIKLSWYKEKCDTSHRHLNHYFVVEWCSPLICRYDNVSVEDPSVHSLSNVEIGVEYRISIAAVTSRGKTKYSKPVKVTVKPLHSSGFVTQNIELISSVVSVMVAVALLLILRRCRNSWKLAKQKFSTKLLLPVPVTDPNMGNGSLRRVPDWTPHEECRQFLNNSNWEQKGDNEKALCGEQYGGCETGSEYEISYTELLGDKDVLRPAGYTFMSLDSSELSCDQLQKSYCLAPSILCLSAGNLPASATVAKAHSEHLLLAGYHANQTVLHFPAMKEDLIGLKEEGLKNQSCRKALSEFQNGSENQIVVQPAAEDTRPGDSHASTCIASGYVLPNFLLESGTPNTASVIEVTGRKSLCNTQESWREEDFDTAFQHQINRVNGSPCRNTQVNIYMNIKDPSLDSCFQATASSSVQENPCYNHHGEHCRNITQGSFQAHLQSLGLTLSCFVLTERETTKTELKATGFEITAAEPKSEFVMTEQKEIWLNTGHPEADDGEMGHEREKNSGETEGELRVNQDEQEGEI